MIEKEICLFLLQSQWIYIERIVLEKIHDRQSSHADKDKIFGVLHNRKKQHVKRDPIYIFLLFLVMKQKRKVRLDRLSNEFLVDLFVCLI
jgi:hypothetical protein